MSNVNKVMSKKQDIKKEIAQCIGEKDCELVWEKACQRLETIYNSYPELPKGVRVHTDNIIFPASAIYLAIKEYKDEIAFDIMEKSMREKSLKVGKAIGSISRLPGFKTIFFMMWDIMSHMMFSNGNGFENVFYPKMKREYKMDIVSCPYKRYLTELGCPEISVLFCKNDEYCYGNITGIDFIRTQTLASGGTKCDFRLVMK